jgi:hypothetical protein
MRSGKAWHRHEITARTGADLRFVPAESADVGARPQPLTHNRHHHHQPPSKNYLPGDFEANVSDAAPTSLIDVLNCHQTDIFQLTRVSLCQTAPVPPSYPLIRSSCNSSNDSQLPSSNEFTPGLSTQPESI